MIMKQFPKTSSKKPIIAITRHGERKRDIEWLTYIPLWWATKFAIWRAGGKSITIRPHHDHNNIAFDGLLLAGGLDIHPARYKKNCVVKTKENYPYDTARDDMEGNLLKKALKENKPILGICRGMQLMNVDAGGCLLEDISDHLDTLNWRSNYLHQIFSFRKPIKITEKTLLSEILGATEIDINSLHTQAVNKVAPSFEITAMEMAGDIVQVIENKEKNILGVQFHPELLIHKKPFQNIFNWLVATARTK